MINGTVKTEQSYRQVPLDSSSSLKEFCANRQKYFRKYIMNEDVPEEDTKASVMGRVVETLLLEPELFDERFYISACPSTPTEKMLDFVERLYEVDMECVGEDGMYTKSFAERSLEAYNRSGFKLSYNAVISKFSGSDAEIYYNEIKEVRKNGLTVISAEDLANGEKNVNELKNNFATKDIVNLIDSERYTVKNQLQVEDFEVFGHKFKAMMDKVVIDHKEKTIQIYDLKCVWAVENFYYEYYLKRYSYIQAYIYYCAGKELTKKDEYKEYRVLYPKFIVCDSINYSNPLIYTLDNDDITDAINGFNVNGREYKGVLKLIQELNWALDNGIWNISMDNYLSNGIVKLKKQ